MRAITRPCSQRASGGAPATRRRTRDLALLAATALVLSSILPPGAVGRTRPPQDGEAVFQAKCAACHTLGGGNTLGPDLSGIMARRDRDWLARWIATPDRMLAAGDSVARAMLQQFNNIPMPNLGLSEAEVAAVLAYLESRSGAEPAPATTRSAAAAQTAAPGDARAGKDLFAGIARFANGGPPCMACHSVAGIGAFGGGALGPDLTASYGKFGQAGLASILAGPPFPTMRPIYESRPLTPEEQVNLGAYLEQATTAKRPARVAGRLAALAVVGMSLLFGLAHVAWRGRLTAVRRPIVREAARHTPERTAAGKGA